MERFWQWIIDLYAMAPLSIRFAYTFWLLLGAQYAIIQVYEILHNDRVGGRLRLKKKRKPEMINLPWAVHVPLWLSLIGYNFGNAVARQAPICAAEAIWLVKFLSVVGFLLLIYGLVLATWGRLSLNGYWGPNCYDYGNEKMLITGGAYKFIRHPIYSGQTLMAVGTFLIAQSWWGGLLLAVPLLAFIRGWREEGFMVRAHGDEYKKYRRKTSAAIIPWRTV